MEVKLISYSQINLKKYLEILTLKTLKILLHIVLEYQILLIRIIQRLMTKLLKYLIREKHWSPFEMVNVCLEITTTRDIARQILRHRSFSFQEFSQRYANPLR